MQLKVDSQVLAQGGAQIVEIADQIQASVTGAAQALSQAADAVGHDSLERVLRELRRTVNGTNAAIVEDLSNFGLQIQIAAAAYAETDSELSQRIRTEI